MIKTLSIIIPTYNMEKYLHRCLDSLLLSPDQMEKFEVLIINDGSKDTSSDIAHGYQSRFPQTFRVIDKENGNYGSCVNRGVEEAKGKYVKVLDADDWFDSNIFDHYLDFLTTTDVDMILTDYQEVDGQGTARRKHSIPYVDREVMKIVNRCCDMAFANLQMHAVTYRLSLLRENGYKQTTGVSYTDQEWMFLPVTYMDSFCHYKGFLYQYLVGREGQTVDPTISSKQVDARFVLIYKRLNIYNGLLHDESMTPSKRVYLQHRLLQSCSDMYRDGVIKQYFDKGLIETFDKETSQLSKPLYDELSHSGYGRYHGLRYIGYWRKHHQLPLILRIVRRILKYTGVCF